MSKRAANKPPPHPGEVLARDVIPGIGLSVTRLAADLGISNQLLHLIIHEQANVTAATALRLAAYLDCNPEIWTGLQARHDLWHKEREIGPELERIRKRGKQ